MNVNTVLIESLANETPKYVICGAGVHLRPELLERLAIREHEVVFIDDIAELKISHVMELPKREAFELTCNHIFDDYIELAKTDNKPFWRNLPTKKKRR